MFFQTHISQIADARIYGLQPLVDGRSLAALALSAIHGAPSAKDIAAQLPPSAFIATTSKIIGISCQFAIIRQSRKTGERHRSTTHPAKVDRSWSIQNFTDQSCLFHFRSPDDEALWLTAPWAFKVSTSRPKDIESIAKQVRSLFEQAPPLAHKLEQCIDPNGDDIVHPFFSKKDADRDTQLLAKDLANKLLYWIQARHPSLKVNAVEIFGQAVDFTGEVCPVRVRLHCPTETLRSHLDLISSIQSRIQDRFCGEIPIIPLAKQFAHDCNRPVLLADAGKDGHVDIHSAHQRIEALAEFDALFSDLSGVPIPSA